MICDRCSRRLFIAHNCVSLRMNQTLVYVDLMGISCMAYGSPWIYYVANRLNEGAGADGMRHYVLLLGSM